MTAPFSRSKLLVAPALSLFASSGTLLCCALPALLVSLGAGATLASFLSRFPQLIWLSENKATVFTIAALGLVLGGVAQWRARRLPCPRDPALARACASARRWSRFFYFGSVIVFSVGFSFAYILPHLI